MNYYIQIYVDKFNIIYIDDKFILSMFLLVHLR